MEARNCGRAQPSELIDAVLARQLASLLGVKPIVHYGDSFIGSAALTRCLRAMDHLIAAAEAMLA